MYAAVPELPKGFYGNGVLFLVNITIKLGKENNKNDSYTL
jgi:hypothetical protein